jgi:shikimate kinase
VTPRVVLVGLPGAGKSTTGRRLAKILAVPFADSDHLIEEREGRPVVELFATRGEAACRDIEVAVIADALVEATGVLSLGGGAVMRAETRDALAASGAPVVYLRAALQELAENPHARLAGLAAERGAVLAAVATFTVDTDGRTPGQVAATIAARLHERQVRR